ncbi:hypothetical protein DCAR_0519707 [Daucus carota subsp. sativus]|uniref:HVA22-like protein n=1 Tax=Daucus carota subsp. sativus TaxID=79200 RepID=A0AAF0X2G3_DAUCS|nr:hypothetical protein DCAR_0519707 [Daucus carota subsp. sativus]
MDVLGTSIAGEVGLRLLLSPLNSTIVMRTACCSVGIVVPVYSSVKAIETGNQQDQKKWLLYWAVYGSFSIAEIYSDKLLSWFPSYYYVKLAFLIWLQLPDTQGAKILYKNHLQPFLKRHEAKIDRVMGLTYIEMAKLISSHQKELQYLKSILARITLSSNTAGPAPPDNPAVVEDQSRGLPEAAPEADEHRD